MTDQPETAPPVEEKQCRICLDGPDATLGRLIRPCLCKGSMTVRRTLFYDMVCVPIFIGLL